MLLTDRLENLCGWRVFRVPEAASILLNGGFTFWGLSQKQRFEFQCNLMRVMLQLEDAFMALARLCGKNAVVLCDRGAMDARAYMEEDEWTELLKLNNCTNEVRTMHGLCMRCAGHCRRVRARVCASFLIPIIRLL